MASIHLNPNRSSSFSTQQVDERAIQVFTEANTLSAANNSPRGSTIKGADPGPSKFSTMLNAGTKCVAGVPSQA